MNKSNKFKQCVCEMYETIYKREESAEEKLKQIKKQGLVSLVVTREDNKLYSIEGYLEEKGVLPDRVYALSDVVSELEETPGVPEYLGEPAMVYSWGDERMRYSMYIIKPDIMFLYVNMDIAGDILFNQGILEKNNMGD